jgi:cytidylate kinase
VSDAPALGRLAETLDVAVRPPSVRDGRDADVLLGERDVTWEIRSPEVDRAVSAVAARPEVRAALIGAQRRAAHAGGAVVVGRDIGTVIFPEAPLKVYLEASPEERARRRQAELTARGTDLPTSDVLGDLLARDALDAGRATAPLAVARDAVRIPTEGLTADAVAERVVELWGARCSRSR